jgi:hypothetical protein
MRVNYGFVIIVGVTYALLGELLHRTVIALSQPYPAQYRGAALCTVAAALVFTGTTAAFARRQPVPWASWTALHAGAAAALGAAIALIAAASRVGWGAACNQCRPGLFIPLGTGLATAVAALAALPVGALARRLPRRVRPDSGAPAG